MLLKILGRTLWPGESDLVGHQGQVAGPLHCRRNLALVLGAHPRHTARTDLAALGHEITHPPHVRYASVSCLLRSPVGVRWASFLSIVRSQSISPYVERISTGHVPDE